ncbi:hypothetical protein [Bacillus sp. FJAT-27445]|uniref:hypothetical protein n=1 Tax=Bacillus sp. FJAT-27445 TaxID=1679166 RepID=UPI0007435724|nr:hypothetical protein [Bacillus sp. FJAT-27445]
MNVFLKRIWTFIVVVSVFSLLWFLLGTTANFQRYFDLVDTVFLIYFWFPNLVLTIALAFFLSKGWMPASWKGYLGIFSGLILALVLSLILIKNVNTHGWLTETIRSDTLKITVDKKYEYRLELINLFQRNSRAELYVKTINSSEVIKIPVDIDTKEISGIWTDNEVNWVLMEPKGNSDRYILTTTEELGIPEEKFEINIPKATSKRLK